MSTLKCKWCGRGYDSLQSTASDFVNYCSGKCEAEAKRAKMEVERLELEKRRLRQESGSDNNISWWDIFRPLLIPIAIILIIVMMCTDNNDENKENQDPKASPQTEQVTTTNK